jgi:hypothetical protein
MPESKDRNLPDPRFPIGPFYELLDARTYVRTTSRIVALCALKGKYGKELKLYEWNWKGEEKGWKVGLANLRVDGLNLARIAEDAQALATEQGFPLRWK